MKRLVRIVAVMAAGLVATAGAAHAQTADTGKFYAEATASSSFGHTSSGAFGAEIGYRLTKLFGVYLEGGRIKNVASADVEAKAKIIGDALGTTAKVTQAMNYFSAGVTAEFPMGGRFTPRAQVGFGGSGVETKTVFGVAPGSQVLLGGDLTGHYRKSYFTIGVGTHVAIAGQWFADVSYRYGKIGDYADFESNAIKINRIQFGFGRRLF